MKTIFVILGPTSTGKTSLAVELCKRFSGQIISADSRQIYRKMDIGTGKIPFTTNVTAQNFKNYWTLDDIVVWGYDLANPDEYFSAYDWASYALPKAKEILESGKTAFLVGGTGFYIDIFTARQKPAQIKPDFNLRKELELENLENLQKQLTSLNQKVFDSIDNKNPARLIRAIEIELGKKSATPLPYLENVNFEFIGLTADRLVLNERADKWLETIWENGLLPETESLIDAGYASARPLNSLIYKSAKTGDKDQARIDLHHYIKRQLTYFKKNPSTTWFNITDPNFATAVSNNVQSKVDG